MAHTYEDLRKKTLAELRDLAKELQHESVQGYSQMNKDHLLPALCTALGIDAHVHHAAHGVAKAEARARLKALRELRSAALASHDHEALKMIRREYHHVNHALRTDARRPA
jgi:hypothetical protein